MKVISSISQIILLVFHLIFVALLDISTDGDKPELLLILSSERFGTSMGDIKEKRQNSFP